MKRRGLCTLLTLSVATACGAGGSSKNAANAGASGANDDGAGSIGELAREQGGIAALGGAGNREEGATGGEVALSGAFHLEEADKKSPVRVDGVLKEWPPRTAASETIVGKTDGLSLDVAGMYDDAKLYLAAEIGDPRGSRSASHRENEDHVSMVLAFPVGRGTLAAYEIGFWAGKPGSSIGAVKWLAGPNKGQDVSGAKIVETDTKGGYAFEASIPWSSFPEARTTRVGLRGTVRYHSIDGTVRGVLATGPGGVDKPGDLPPWPTAAEQAVVDGLLAQKNLAGEKPRIDIYADLTGDERRERVSVFGKFFTICGPGYRSGHQFFWREVTGDIVSVEARDVTGHGKDDLVVHKRVPTSTSTQEILEIWSLVPGDEPVTVLAQPIAVISNDGKRRVTSAARVSTKEVEVAVQPAVGWDAATFKETIAVDAEPVLLPWGNVRSRTFRFDKGRFVKASEVAQQGAAPVAPPTGERTGDAPPQPALARDVPTPPVKSGSDRDGRQVLDAYYRDAGGVATKPRFDLEVHVDGDAKPERVLLVGRDIVVLGPAFKGGTGYAKLTLSQFAEDKDVSELTARDLTGDGAAEIIVRGARRVTTPQGERVDTEGLFVYQLRGGNIARVFAIETGREQAGKRIQGLVQFVPSKNGKGFDVDVRPGMAKGWTEKTYPWPQDRPGGTIEPLLLPWSKVNALRYVWNGTQYAPAP